MQQYFHLGDVPPLTPEDLKDRPPVTLDEFVGVLQGDSPTLTPELAEEISAVVEVGDEFAIEAIAQYMGQMGHNLPEYYLRARDSEGYLGQ